MGSDRTLCSGFLRSAEAFPDRPALEVEGRRLTYRELRDRSASLAATLTRERPSEGPPLTAVFAYRSVTAFAGILGALMSGHGYVPLNRAFPPERTRTMLRDSGCRSMIVDSASAEQLNELLKGTEYPMLILFPECEDAGKWSGNWPAHTFLGSKDLQSPRGYQQQTISAHAVAYILYTSGSTGTPKGVMISHSNMGHFIDAMVARYGFDENDRFSQLTDLTFDVSTFELFVAWECGACVCCPDQKALILAGKFIRDSGLTVWYAVPSFAIQMRRLGMAKPDQYPNLRLSLFAGEGLPVELARSWKDAAPQATVENLYGPTELTVTCTSYRYDPERIAEESELGWVPIGDPNPGLDAIIVDEHLREVAAGSAGELLVGGPQVAPGYWRDPEKTARAFVTPPGKNEIYYRTGDLVRRRAGGPLVFLGRLDHQIKIRGFRIEPGEVEMVLREASGCETAVVVGWPITSTGVGGIVAFLDDPAANAQAIISRLRSRLPSHMVPSQIRLLSQFPLNPNGKVDRKAILKLLEEEST